MAPDSKGHRVRFVGVYYISPGATLRFKKFIDCFKSENCVCVNISRELKYVYDLLSWNFQRPQSPQQIVCLLSNIIKYYQNVFL